MGIFVRVVYDFYHRIVLNYSSALSVFYIIAPVTVNTFLFVKYVKRKVDVFLADIESLPLFGKILTTGFS